MMNKSKLAKYARSSLAERHELMCRRYFFEGDLAQFNITIETPIKVGGKSAAGRLDRQAIILAIGDRMKALVWVVQAVLTLLRHY